MTDQSIRALRLLRDAFGVTFKIKEDANILENNDKAVRGVMGNIEKNKVDKNDGPKLGNTILLSCLGTGYVNMSRRIK